MRERGLLPDFSPAVMSEADALTHAATDGTVRDLRTLLWASIDNDDSRDLDQLSVAGATGGAAETILVAVSDVDALVRKGSDIDNYAAVNTTSVYTAAEIFPMLPEKLSTNLTSLNPDEDRLAVVVEMTVAADGSVTKSAITAFSAITRAAK
jgi:exoribonuclease-2